MHRLTDSCNDVVCSVYCFVFGPGLDRCIVWPAMLSINAEKAWIFPSLIYRIAHCLPDCFVCSSPKLACLISRCVYMLNFVPFDSINTVWDCHGFGLFSVATKKLSFTSFECIRLGFLPVFALFGSVFIVLSVKLMFCTHSTHGQNGVGSFCKIIQMPIASKLVRSDW
jgi:hypothetical protein